MELRRTEINFVPSAKCRLKALIPFSKSSRKIKEFHAKVRGKSILRGEGWNVLPYRNITPYMSWTILIKHMNNHFESFIFNLNNILSNGLKLTLLDNITRFYSLIIMYYILLIENGSHLPNNYLLTSFLATTLLISQRSVELWEPFSNTY